MPSSRRSRARRSGCGQALVLQMRPRWQRSNTSVTFFTVFLVQHQERAWREFCLIAVHWHQGVIAAQRHGRVPAQPPYREVLSAFTASQRRLAASSSAVAARLREVAQAVVRPSLVQPSTFASFVTRGPSTGSMAAHFAGQARRRPGHRPRALPRAPADFCPAMRPCSLFHHGALQIPGHAPPTSSQSRAQLQPPVRMFLSVWSCDQDGRLCRVLGRRVVILLEPRRARFCRG